MTMFEDLRDERDKQFQKRHSDSGAWKDPGRRYIKKIDDFKPKDDWLQQMEINRQQKELEKLNAMKVEMLAEQVKKQQQIIEQKTQEELELSKKQTFMAMKMLELQRDKVSQPPSFADMLKSDKDQLQQL